MERDSVVLSFQSGKRRLMTENTENVSRDEAQTALESVAKLEGAGRRRRVLGY
jgi:hypothetical protein